MPFESLHSPESHDKNKSEEEATPASSENSNIEDVDQDVLLQGLEKDGIRIERKDS